jgi:hypothetical protein
MMFPAKILIFHSAGNAGQAQCLFPAKNTVIFFAGNLRRKPLDPEMYCRHALDFQPANAGRHLNLAALLIAEAEAIDRWNQAGDGCRSSVRMLNSPRIGPGSKIQATLLPIAW